MENYLSYQNNSSLRGKYLIGLHRQVTGFDKWVTGEPVTYTNWGEMEPDNLGNCQDMVIFNNGGTIGYGNGGYKIDFGQWDDDTNSSYRYICEWDFKPVWSNSSAWSSPELQKAQELDLIPEILYEADMTRTITRQEFAAVAVKTYENLAGTKALPAVINPFTDCKDTEVLKAYNLGITNGTSAGSTTFSPNKLLDRQEAATMLARTFKRATMPGWTMEQDASYPLSYTKPTPLCRRRPDRPLGQGQRVLHGRQQHHRRRGEQPVRPHQCDLCPGGDELRQRHPGAGPGHRRADGGKSEITFPAPKPRRRVSPARLLRERELFPAAASKEAEASPTRGRKPNPKEGHPMKKIPLAPGLGPESGAPGRLRPTDRRR